MLDKESDNNGMRVAIARKDGMLIQHNPKGLERFPLTAPFEMYVCVDGKRGSERLKQIETPRHDGFDFNRVDDAAEREAVKKDYEKIMSKIREIIKAHAGIKSEQEQSDSTLNKWFQPSLISDSHGEGAERSNQMKISESKTIFPKRADKKFKSGDGENATQEGQGRRGGKGRKKSVGGSKPGRGKGMVTGKGVPTTGRVNHRKLDNLRVIHDAEKKQKATLIFDNPGEGVHQLVVLLVGEEHRDRLFLQADSSTQSDNVTIQLGHEPRQMVTIDASIEIADFALEANLLVEEDPGGFDE